jgi:hypothetical protein
MQQMADIKIYPESIAAIDMMMHVDQPTEISVSFRHEVYFEDGLDEIIIHFGKVTKVMKVSDYSRYNDVLNRCFISNAGVRHTIMVERVQTWYNEDYLKPRIEIET